MADSFIPLKAKIDGANNPTAIAEFAPGDPVVFPGTGVFFRADFTSARPNGRAHFQTTTANAATVISAMPSGSGDGSIVDLYSSSDTSNYRFLRVSVNSAAAAINCGNAGTTSAIPLNISSGGNTGFILDTNGDHCYGTNNANPILNKANGFRYFATGGWNHYAETGNNLGLGIGPGATHFVRFRYNGGTEVGSISTNGSTTAFNTTSDYRAKFDILALSVASAYSRVMALRPITHKWKANPELPATTGFLAHELQEHIPEAVTGQKDATVFIDTYNEDGEVIGQEEVPDYQGVDLSKCVPDIVAAFQYLAAKVEQLEAEIKTLKGV